MILDGKYYFIEPSGKLTVCAKNNLHLVPWFTHQKRVCSIIHSCLSLPEGMYGDIFNWQDKTYGFNLGFFHGNILRYFMEEIMIPSCKLTNFSDFCGCYFLGDQFDQSPIFQLTMMYYWTMKMWVYPIIQFHSHEMKNILSWLTNEFGIPYF